MQLYCLFSQLVFNVNTNNKLTALSPFDCFRVFSFNQRLQDVQKEILAFKKKKLMNMEEIKNNVRHLTQITTNLVDAVTELEVREATFLLPLKYTCYPFIW